MHGKNFLLHGAHTQYETSQVEVSLTACAGHVRSAHLIELCCLQEEMLLKVLRVHISPKVHQHLCTKVHGQMACSDWTVRLGQLHRLTILMYHHTWYCNPIYHGNPTVSKHVTKVNETTVLAALAKTFWYTDQEKVQGPLQ